LQKRPICLLLTWNWPALCEWNPNCPNAGGNEIGKNGGFFFAQKLGKMNVVEMPLAFKGNLVF